MMDTGNAAEVAGLLAAVCGIVFGVPITIVVMEALRSWTQRQASTRVRARALGILFGGVFAALSVNVAFSVAWTCQLGFSGWRDDSAILFGGWICLSTFVVLPGSLFGGVICAVDFSSPAPATRDTTDSPEREINLPKFPG